MPPEEIEQPHVERREIRQLTGIRFVAAVWVVLYHFQFMIFGLAPELHPAGFLFDSGYLAVDLFFVLSGYIIAYQYLDAFPRGRGDYRGFLVRRLARIYPLQLLTLVLAILMIVVAMLIGVAVPSPDNFTVLGAVQDLFLVRGWEPVPHQGWNFPAWSLSAEWFAYLLFPVLALAVGVLRRGSRGWLLVVVAVAVVLEGLGAWLIPSFNGMPHPLVRVLAGFAAGVAIFAWGPLPVRRRNPGLLAALVALVALLLLVVVAGRIDNGGLRAVVVLVLAAVVVAGLANGSGPVIRVLGGRFLEWGGRISYGIYMIHGIVLMIGGALLAVLVVSIPRAAVLHWPLALRIGLLLVPLGLIGVLGAVLYRWVERPAQKWIVRVARRRRAVALAPIEPAPIERAPVEPPGVEPG